MRVRRVIITMEILNSGLLTVKSIFMKKFKNFPSSYNIKNYKRKRTSILLSKKVIQRAHLPGMAAGSIMRLNHAMMTKSAEGMYVCIKW